MVKENNNPDLLIAGIKQMIADYSGPAEKTRMYNGFHVGNLLVEVKELVKQDRARQQAEKEKMIAELEAYKPTREQQLDNPLLSLGMTSGMIYAIEVIQGKEQKEEREMSK